MTSKNEKNEISFISVIANQETRYVGMEFSNSFILEGMGTAIRYKVISWRPFKKKMKKSDLLIVFQFFINVREMYL